MTQKFDGGDGSARSRPGSRQVLVRAFSGNESSGGGGCLGYARGRDVGTVCKDEVEAEGCGRFREAGSTPTVSGYVSTLRHGWLEAVDPCLLPWKAFCRWQPGLWTL